MKKYKIILILIITIFSINIENVFASKIYFEPSKIDSINNEYLVEVLLDSESEMINALDGKLIFPDDILEIKEIHDGNSNINFWIQSPKSKQKGEIVFSGITPGGITGNKLLIFSVIFRQLNNKDGKISVNDIKILKNDGEGTEAKVKIIDLKLPIQSDMSIDLNKEKDIVPPEDFEPSILFDKEFSDNKKLLVFATQDKDSGIDHYEIRNGYFDEYTIAESPFELKTANKKIYIKALDKAGNERVVEFYPEGRFMWYVRNGIIAIILVVIVLFGIKKVWSKFSR